MGEYWKLRRKTRVHFLRLVRLEPNGQERLQAIAQWSELREGTLMDGPITRAVRSLIRAWHAYRTGQLSGKDLRDFQLWLEAAATEYIKSGLHR